jgi:hypothetical protein
MIARAMEQETELKFLIASEDLVKVKTLPHCGLPCAKPMTSASKPSISIRRINIFGG